MSVNITVSGKFAKHCTHPLLVDPQDAKRAEEKERRKLRLLQVREESKKLAKKIRDEVNEEKKRELQKLQAIKEKELECWRQHALQRKGEDYRSAIFQIGTAHHAARIENEEKCVQQNKHQESYKDFKKKMAARKCQPEKVKFNCQTNCPCQQPHTSANKQLKCTCVKAQDKNVETQEAHKRKRNLSFSSSESEDEGYKEQTTLPQSSISLSSSSTSDSSTLSTSVQKQASINSMFVPTKNKCLIKTPAVCLDVEVGSDDSITISAPAEIKDKYCKYNRQFSSVIRLSPRKDRHKKENTCENPSTQQSSTTTTILSSETSKNERDQSKSNFEKPQNTQFTAIPLPKEKRFTIISELVKKQENVPTNVPKNRVQPSNSQTTSANITPLLSPRKQLREVPDRLAVVNTTVTRSPRKTSAATSKSSRTLSTQPLTYLKSNSAAISSSSCSGRVQFYDYNSKLAKEQDQSAIAVTVQRQRDQTTPSAMEQAEEEKQKDRERQLEEVKKIQQAEDRGQKALEREQIRRDCNELTEKLEVLSQDYAKQLPTNDNQLHIFADKQLRKEGKMNTAIEKLLQRPAIITCSEQHKPSSSGEHKQKSARREENLGHILNVASLNNKPPLPADDVSSDSCCSILLGYVDDQSKLIEQDIKKSENSQNQTKQMRLKDLLKRLDNLRNSLLEELKHASKFKDEIPEKGKTKVASEENNLKQVIDSITELRKEHEEIFANEREKCPKSLREREKLLKAKEELLERKVREFFELQYQPTQKQETLGFGNIKQNTNKEIEKVCATGENPLEIVITVKGDTKCVQIPQKPRRKVALRKTPSKISTLIKSPLSSLAKTKKHTPNKKTLATNSLRQQDMLRRQNSYDSNSTSYRSLPPELPTKMKDLAQAIVQQTHDQPSKLVNKKETGQQTSPKHDIQQESESSSLESLNIAPPRINPLIAQYVQRLLGMSRGDIHKLGVSSTDVETPTPSIINTPGNIAFSESHVTDERLSTLQNFIEENKSFIKDIELSIRSQNNESLENSFGKLEDIWRKRLKKEKQIKKRNEQSPKRGRENALKHKSPAKEKRVISDEKSSKVQQVSKPVTSKTKANETKSLLKESLLKDLSKSLSSHYSSEDKESTKSVKPKKPTIETVDKAINAKLSTDSNKTETDMQIARYAKLTENCTHRIAELTELINRVREEKQRLLEVTLSSVSDNGRHSTEYRDLPEGKTRTRIEQDDLTRVSSSSEEITQNKQSVTSSNILNDMPRLSLADKNKQLANSRDSGIAESRPVTALDNRHDQEPLSQTSSESATALLPPAMRKMKPPPTLKRFSPQLPENELAHELSTIFEVDTPATSRINTAIGHSAEEKEQASSSNGSQQRIQFPTFEQYIEKMNLNITQLNAEQSLQLQQEFLAFLECLQDNKFAAESPKYSEFPSINAYLQQLAESDYHLGDTLEESLAKLHISGIQASNFPAVREYIQHNLSKTLQSETQQLLDTESLENVTDMPTRTNTDNDTASLDIQEELRKRKILKEPFRISKKSDKQIFSSTRHKEADYYQQILAAESGIDKLSTSVNTSDLLDNSLKDLVKQFSKTEKRKTKEAHILSSTTMSTNTTSMANSALRAASLNESAKKETGRPFNFRDFLTRELEKQINNSSSSNTSSSIDESLRSYFLHSLLGSLTPYTPGAASKSGGQTLERQKTSTPVPVQSSRAHSTSNSQTSGSSSHLFSGESRLSSVHYQNRSVEAVISSGDAANADQSSD